MPTSQRPLQLKHMPPDGRYHLEYNLGFREVARGTESLCQRLFHACVPIAKVVLLSSVLCPKWPHK